MYAHDSLAPASSASGLEQCGLPFVVRFDVGGTARFAGHCGSADAGHPPLAGGVAANPARGDTVIGTLRACRARDSPSPATPSCDCSVPAAWARSTWSSIPGCPGQDALKILSATVSADTDFRARFIREADLAAALSHPNIVAIYDRGEVDNQLWISMQYVKGTDAAQLLHQRYPAGMPAQEATPIIAAVAGALDYAHRQGLLHRDVKPGQHPAHRS